MICQAFCCCFDVLCRRSGTHTHTQRQGSWTTKEGLPCKNRESSRSCSAFGQRLRHRSAPRVTLLIFSKHRKRHMSWKTISRAARRNSGGVYLVSSRLVFRFFFAGLVGADGGRLFCSPGQAFLACGRDYRVCRRSQRYRGQLRHDRRRSFFGHTAGEPLCTWRVFVDFGSYYDTLPPPSRLTVVCR